MGIGGVDNGAGSAGVAPLVGGDLEAGFDELGGVSRCSPESADNHYSGPTKQIWAYRLIPTEALVELHSSEFDAQSFAKPAIGQGTTMPHWTRRTPAGVRNSASP